ncbi:MAG: DUF3486 family protein [Azoarcus sp.]|jgi:Zn-dependent M16 (insulinase) family peptidase|nr:DUF3486 family protein [Azoarcus sp.]
MGTRSKISKLPEDVRRWIEAALIENNFSEYQKLAAMLRERGYSISKSALHNHGQQMEEKLSAIRASTEAARVLVESAPDDQDARSEAIISLVQTELFNAIFSLQKAQATEDIGERIETLSAAAKNIATLARASINQKKYRGEVQERARAAAEKAETLAVKGGMSTETVAEIRRAILGIAA